MFTKARVMTVIGVASLVSLCAAVAWAEIPPSPVLGVDVTLVNLNSQTLPAPHSLPNRGLRIDRVYAHTVAARLGLEPGDIVVSIDSMRFTTMAGFRQALVCAGQRPSFLIIDVNTHRLVRRSVDMPHRTPDGGYCRPMPPDSYLMAIDLRSDFRR